MIIIDFWLDGGSEDEIPSSSKNTEPEDSGVEKIRKYLAQKLGIHDSEKEANESQGSQILAELSLDGIAEFIKSSGCRKVITMAGAGISTCRYTRFI